MKKVTLINGDGIGPEITDAVVKIIEASGLKIDWELQTAGADVIEQEGTPLPERVIESIKRNKVALKAPVTTPIGKGFRSVNVQLRKALDLYSNLRPCKNIDGIKTRFDNVDLVIVRENTEDLYAGIERQVDEDHAESIKTISREASLRIAKFAFDYAVKYGRKKVTAVTKANICKLTDGLFLTCCKEVKEQFHISVGNFMCPAVTCKYDEAHKIFLGKAFDCRIGCAAVMDVLHQLKDVNHNIEATLTTQEEVGERGMDTAIKNLSPNIAICFEGCPSDDTFEPDYMIQSALKKGPMLRWFDRSYITSPRFMRYAIDLAHEKNIPVQESVRKGGGTNAGITHRYNIPTIIIGIPVRFAHASFGICSEEDYDNAVKLAVEIIKNIDAQTIRGF